jgi:hypothetical protein
LSDQLSLDEHHGQAIRSRGADQLVNRLVLDKLQRLLSQIKPLDFVADGSKPLEVGGKLRQSRIDLGAANPGRATHWRIEYLNQRHRISPK